MSSTAERQVACAQLAARQHGVLSVGQALEIGMSRPAISRLVTSGRWRWALPRILAPGHEPLTLMGRAAGACLWAPDGAISHTAAAAIWRLIDGEVNDIDITTPRYLKAPTGLVVHVHKAVQAQEVSGVRVTTVARTLLDLAATTPAEQLEVALEHALRRRLTSAPSLQRFIETAGGKGRSGTAALRRLVNRYSESPTESYLERKVLPLFTRNGLPQPVTQFWVVAEGERYRLDFAYPSVRVGIEAHSFRWHTGRKSWSHDIRRLNALARAGWVILFITQEDVDERGRRFFENLRRILDAKGFFPPTLPLFENLDGRYEGGAGYAATGRVK